MKRSDFLYSGTFFQRILLSRQPVIVLLRRLLLVGMVILGLAGFRFSLVSSVPPNVYHKDFMQEYLMAKAVRSGMDPYLPLPDLAATFLGSLPQINLPHPTPHPPPVVILGLPFSYFPYEIAAIIWLIFEVFFITLSIGLLLEILVRRASLLQIIFLTILILAFRPYVANLSYGQLMTLLLLLLVAAWSQLHKGNELKGGVFLGIATAIKLVAWPLVLYLLLRGRWKAVGGAVLAFLGANMTAGLLMGHETILDYYLEVSAAVTPLYRAHEGNFSLWTIGYRFFEGTGSPGLSAITAPPLLSMPQLAAPISGALMIGCLAASMFLAVRCRSFNAAYSLIVCSALLISPIFWVVYLILALIPMAFVLQQLAYYNYPNFESWVTLGLLVFLMIPREILVTLLWIQPYEIVPGSAPVFSFAGSLISLLPTMMIMLLMGLIVRLDRYKT